MADARIEDLYPLTALQGLLLVDARSAADGRTDILNFTLHGPMTREMLEQAWTIVHDRHPTMRAGFVWQNVPQPMQVVRADARPWVRFGDGSMTAIDLLEFGDWSLTTAPQIRLGLVESGDETVSVNIAYRMAMFDGWSVALIVREFLSALESLMRGEPIVLEPATPFRHYVQWFGEQDMTAAERYWSDLLASYQQTTPLRVTHPDMLGTGAPGVLVRKFTESQQRLLQDYSRYLGVTPNTVLQALWGILLSAYADDNSVMFGTAISGRPPGVDGVDGMVGVFFNNLPVCLDVNGAQTASDVVSAMRRQLRDGAEYGHVSPARMRELWAADDSQPLFQSIFLFHNFPLRGTLWEEGRPFTIDAVEKPIKTNIPLTLVCVPELGFELRLIAEDGVADADLKARYLDDYISLIDRVMADPATPVVDLRTQLGKPDVQLYRPQVTAVRDLSTRVGHQPPSTELEVKIAAALETLFSVRNIGVNDNFFEMGVRSIQLARAAMRLTSIGIGPMTAVDLFESPTVKALAARFDGGDIPVPLTPTRSSRDLADARSARRRRADRRGGANGG